MKKAAIVFLFILQANAYAQVPPGQATPQQRLAMQANAAVERQEEISREKHYEQQLAEITQIMQQQLELQRKQLEVQKEQLELQRKQSAPKSVQ